MVDRVEGDLTAGGTSPLGRSLGLSEQEVGVLGRLFVEAARSMGIDGAAVFERLRAGDSLGRALAMPAGLGPLLYARAHRWFSIGRADRAESLFRALCVLDEASADNWVGYGVCLRLRDQYQEAALAFGTAARLRPAWAVPHFHLLELAVVRDAWDEAAQRLADYDARVSDAVPEPMRLEAERMRMALAARRRRQTS